MKIVIAEDNSTSRKLLKSMIQRLPGEFQITGEATNGEELIRLIVTEKPDIALVDIGLPHLNGIDAIKACKELLPSLQVIFITGHEEYAVEAFNLKAVDYIIKPIELTRLKDSLERVTNSHKIGKIYPENIPKNDLMIKQQNSFHFIPLSEIVLIERIERKSVIYTTRDTYEVNDALTNLEELLNNRFITSHRSNIINMDLLDRIEAVGQMYIAYFKNFKKTAKVTKQKLGQIQKFKSCF